MELKDHSKQFLPHQRSGTKIELQWLSRGKALFVKTKASWRATLLKGYLLPTSAPYSAAIPEWPGPVLSPEPTRTFSSFPTKHTGRSIYCVNMLALTRAFGSSIMSTMILPPTLTTRRKADYD